MEIIGRILVITGLLMAGAGVVFILLSRTDLPIGRLPGDIVLQRPNFTFYFPITTCILISIVGSLLLYIVSRFFK